MLEREAQPSRQRTDASPAADRAPSDMSGRRGMLEANPSSNAYDALLGSPRMVAQRRQIQSVFGSAAQLRAALPGQLKSGIESLSGMSMDGVKVHYNSPQPAQLDALAFTRGSDIHIAPQQERHLPHEAWHVVQQAQGRVRPTLQTEGGVPVNDDPDLEREADTIGAQLMSAGRREPAADDLPPADTNTGASPPHAPVNQFARGSSTVQRRIHEWVQDTWQPGEAYKEGKAQFPSEAKGENRYFNDVTGKLAKSPADAAAGLTDLYITKGSLKDLKLPSTTAGQLVDGSSSLQGVDLELSTSFKAKHETGKEEIVGMGFYSFSQNSETWTWNKGQEAGEVDRGKWTDTVGNFLKAFMTANGQLDYIRTRDWYINKTHMIEVDVNYYINRSFGNVIPSIHKDTGGANLFVNLVFTNKAPTIGTEVTIDTRTMSAEKTKSLLLHMPDKQVKDIETARAALKDNELAKKIVSSELPAAGYVSWVDELIWHSSPYIGNRPKWTKADALTVLTGHFEEKQPGVLQMNYRRTKPMTHEAMLIIGMTEGTNLYEWLEDEGGFDALTYNMAWEFWSGGYHINDPTYDEQVRADIEMVKWGDYKVSEVVGEDQDASDPRVEQAYGIRSHAGLMGRPRTLSNVRRAEEVEDG